MGEWALHQGWASKANLLNFAQSAGFEAGADALAHCWPCPKQTNHGGHGCVTWREGCESGSKQAREVWEVALRCAGRTGTEVRSSECKRGWKRGGNCILTTTPDYRRVYIHEYM